MSGVENLRLLTNYVVEKYIVCWRILIWLFVVWDPKIPIRTTRINVSNFLCIFYVFISNIGFVFITCDL